MLTRYSFLWLLTLLLLPGCDALQHADVHHRDLASLMAERLSWMDDVALVKQARGLPVNDPKREAELLAAMEQQGAALGLPASSVSAFFTGQMTAAKVYQEEWLRLHPHAAADTASLPDLKGTVRPALDGIGKRMLVQLKAARTQRETWALLLRARQKLARAGYSSAVIQPAISGLESALKP